MVLSVGAKMHVGTLHPIAEIYTCTKVEMGVLHPITKIKHFKMGTLHPVAKI